MDELLPVLVTYLEDARARVYLTTVALDNEVAVLPLVDAPIDATPHVLEIHAGPGDPLVLLAEPQGPGSAEGFFPLRLSPLDEDHAAVLFASLPPPEKRPSIPEDEEDAPTLLRPPSSTKRFSSQLTPAHLAALGGPPDPTGEMAPETDKLLGAPIAGGKFLIQELLGAGGAGKVYKARHRELRKPIAVKVLHGFYQKDLDFCARFYGEALAASKLDHPNVLRIVDFGQEPDGMLYIAMEYLEGKNLQQLIENEGPQPLDRIVNIMMQVCAGLSVAHDKGIIHRDIKPENIVLVPGVDDDGNPTEVVKVCDFGIAQLHHPDDTGMSVAAQKQIAGTPEYMSPEQCRGEELDARSDLYACGITMYELATGKVPFTGATPMAVITRHLDETPRPPSTFEPSIDPLFEQMIMKSLQKDRRARHDNARELRNDLRELLEPVLMDQPVSAGSAVTPPSFTRRETREASDLPSLENEASRFQELFVSLTGAVSRTTYYERGHKESVHAMDRLATAAEVVLQFRGELSFARRDVGDTVVFSVLTGIGEVYELRKLLSATIFSMFSPKFGEVFQRRSLVALTIEDGIDIDQLTTMVELLSGPEIGADELRNQFLGKGLTRAKLLFASDLLGRERRLPWQVDMCISRLARDLRALPLLRGVDLEGMLALRVQLIADVVRAVPRPDQIRILLENADLITEEVRHIPELARLDTLRSIVDALPLGRIAQVGQAIVADWKAAKLEERSRRVTAELSQRIARDRSPDTDEVLKAMHARGILPIDELPDDLQQWVHAEQMADELILRPESVLRPFEGQMDAMRFQLHMHMLERAMRTLAERGEALALLVPLSWVRKLQGTRGEMARAAARSLEDPTVLEPVARTLFAGVGDARDAAHAVLVLTGSAGARALFMARTKNAVDGGGRARFVATMKRIGSPAWPVLTAALEFVQPSGGGPVDAELAEDVLRALPEVQDEQIGALVARLMRHGGPPVCRAAATALASLWGQRSKPLLVAVLDNADEGVRIAALAALRKVGGVDENVIVRIEKMLGKGGTDLRAAAAAALADTLPHARAQASAILRQALLPQAKGVLARIRGPAAAPEDPLFVLALSRALLTIGGPEGREAVQARAAQADDALRAQILELLPHR
jgi:serine/threonine protein kinase